MQCVPYRGKLFWLSGDIERTELPARQFPDHGSHVAPARNRRVRPRRRRTASYFMDPKHPDRVRRMAPLKGPRPVWLFGLLIVKDARGNETLVSHFTRRKKPRGRTRTRTRPVRRRNGHVRENRHARSEKHLASPTRQRDQSRRTGRCYYYFCAPFARPTRVRAAWTAVTDPASYEALAFDPATGDYGWQKEKPPTTQDRGAAALP